MIVEIKYFTEPQNIKGWVYISIQQRERSQAVTAVETSQAHF